MGYMFSAAVGASIGLLGGYAVARPYFYEWAIKENTDVLQKLKIDVAKELEDHQKQMADLDAATTEVTVANEEHGNLTEELGLMEATSGQEFVPKQPESPPTNPVVVSPTTTPTTTPTATVTATPAIATPTVAATVTATPVMD